MALYSTQQYNECLGNIRNFRMLILKRLQKVCDSLISKQCLKNFLLVFVDILIFECPRNNIHVSGCSTIKGITSPVEYFFGAYSIKSVLSVKKLSVHARMVLKFFACLVQEKNEYEVFDSFFENTY